LSESLSEELEGVTKALAKIELQNAVSLVSDKSVDSFKMWGTPNDIIERVSKLIEEGGGVDRISFGFRRGPEDFNRIKILGEKVLPYFCTKS
jgi:hypothetical protein